MSTFDLSTQELPDGWEVLDGKLHRDLAFADFAEAFAFMARVAEQADAIDHHPDWSNSWNRVTIDLWSHQAGAVTPADVELATRINDVLS